MSVRIAKKGSIVCGDFAKKNKYIKWDEPFEFKTYNIYVCLCVKCKKDTLLAHLVCPLTGNNVKCAKYLLEAGFMDLKKYQEVFDGALQTAISFQNTPGIKILLAEKFSSKEKKVMRDYAMKQM
ncbi:hypothetical protein RFI_01668, partial [Reticulomyxa filosa]